MLSEHPLEKHLKGALRGPMSISAGVLRREPLEVSYAISNHCNAHP